MKANAEDIREYNDYISSFPAERLTTYTAPCCGETLQTLKPNEDRPFSTAASCPFCKTLYFRLVYKNGSVETEVME